MDLYYNFIFLGGKQMKTQDVKKQKKKFYVPNTYTLIMIFIMVAAIATYIVPAGQYNMIKENFTLRI